jgi:hypothetical protein
MVCFLEPKHIHFVSTVSKRFGAVRIVFHLGDAGNIVSMRPSAAGIRHRQVGQSDQGPKVQTSSPIYSSKIGQSLIFGKKKKTPVAGSSMTF